MTTILIIGGAIGVFVVICVGYWLARNALRPVERMTGMAAEIEASDLTLVSGDLRAAADAIRLSRRTLRTIKQNLGWAFGSNLAALPLAAAGYPNPVIPGAAARPG